MSYVGFSIEHPRGGSGEPSVVSLIVDRGLKSGKVDSIPVNEDELIRLVYGGAEMLVILRGVRT